MSLIKEKEKMTQKALGNDFQYDNVMQTAKLEKVIIAVGIGSTKDKKKIEVIQNRLEMITGQKPAPRGAKKSIAAFKLREGDTVGYQTTLRGKRMYDFLDRLIHVALPRTKDFRGLRVSNVDSMGNATIGIKEHTIFPETADEESKDVFGLAVTVVTTSTSKEETLALLRHLGFPLRKD